MRLADPLYLLFLLPVLVLAVLYLKGAVGREATLRFSDTELIRASGGKPSRKRRWIHAFLRTLALVLFVLALARPQTGHGQREETKNVIDIMIAIDTSTSMETLDCHPDNRLGAAKLEAKRFVQNRPHDRMGVVVFAQSSITQCPLTTDRQAVLNLIDRIRTGMLEDGTAIGVGLANAVNRLKDSEAKSKIVILLTDGVNNSGEIDPVTASKIAKEFGVRVYTIGVGVDGEAFLPVSTPQYGKRMVRVRTEIDEETLKKISQTTGGLYFRARDEKGLRSIFGEIDRLEKTEIKVESYTYYEDHFRVFLWMGLLVFLVELLVMNLLIVRIP